MNKSIYKNILKNLINHLVEIRTTDRGWEEGSFYEYKDIKISARTIEVYIGLTEYHEMLYA